MMLSHSDYCDRTKELWACTESYRQRILSGRVAPPRSSRKQRIQKVNYVVLNNSFTPRSKDILSDLSFTLQKLAKLKLLNDVSSLYEQMDESARHKSLCQLIKIIQSDISGCNKSICSLNSLVTELFTKMSLNNLSQVSKHCQSIIINLQSYLASITTDFKTILVENKDIIAEEDVHKESNHLIQDSSKTKHQNSINYVQSFADFQASTSQAPPPQPSHTAPTSNLLLQPLMQNKKSSEPPVVDTVSRKPKYPKYPVHDQTYSMRPQNSSPSSAHNIQLQSQVQQEKTQVQTFVQLPVVDQEIRQRDASMRNVEQTIVQLGEIYQQFNTLVAEQGEMVTRIDSHVDESLTSIQSAHAQITSFFKTVSRRRHFMMKAFATLIIVFTIIAFITR